MTRFRWGWLLFFIFPVFSVQAASNQPPADPGSPGQALRITTPDFAQEGKIPKRLTCDGADQSPTLRWTRGPRGTESFVILMEDPDAPGGVFTHWILFDIPPTVTFIPKGMPPIRKLANAEKHGTNSFRNLGYGGPCPPEGSEHRYEFRIYALDSMLNLEPGVQRDAVKSAMKGHVLSEGILAGKYRR